MELKVTTTCHSDHTVISLAGEIDVYTAPRLAAELDGALAGGPVTLVVDMSGVDFCDSTGINVLLSAHRQAAGRGGGIQLSGTRRTVRRVLRVTGLDTVFTILEDPAPTAGA